MKVVLAIDLGTTGNRVLAFSKEGKIVAKSYYEFPQIFPKPGWVEHNPIDIWETTYRALKDVIETVGIDNIETIGITNQRETTILWEKDTGKPVYNAIVWQCCRTEDICKKLKEYSPLVKEKTGLPLDPYFSATKIKWILDNVSGVNHKILRKKVIFGTVDTWILWNLTGKKIHATEASNASRTLCYNIRTLNYDKELLKIFSLPESIFPEIKSNGYIFGFTDKNVIGKQIPISGILGDQQASLFANCAGKKGTIKNTYGTGLFIMGATENKLIPVKKISNTIAWDFRGDVNYALEGSVFIGGACIQWLRDGLKIIKNASDTEEMANKLSSNEGVYFVPALVGLGAPYWDSTARGVIIGITRGTKKEHIARAALESIAYQTKDIIETIKEEANLKIEKLVVDGGASQNNFLMQFQANILGIPVERPEIIENTGLGAAGIAGISVGFWDLNEFINIRKIDKLFLPNFTEDEISSYYNRWKKAIQRALRWA